MFRIIESASAARRLSAARTFVEQFPRDAEILIVAASRGAADDFARSIAVARGASFGLYRFSLTQLAARLAAPLLAAQRSAPTTLLGAQAVSARALFEAGREEGLSYFQPVQSTPGFPRALARTLEELRLASIPASDVRGLPDGGRDLAGLLERFQEEYENASAVDRSAFLRTAARAAEAAGAPYVGYPLVMLDVPIADAAEHAVIAAFAGRSSNALATVPAGDSATRARLARLGRIEQVDPDGGGGLDRIRRHLFAAAPPPVSNPTEEVELFSAPGEGRETIEIARRVLREARAGVPFDRMAIVVRAPQQYASLLEHALRRAGVRAYFDRGTRRPHPAGRAFLALLACAVEGLSARRFAEYLSLGQVPELTTAVAPSDAVPASTDEIFGTSTDSTTAPAADEGDVDPDEDTARRATRQALRAPWKWERLLMDSRVVAGEERWSRRLNGLMQEHELQRRELLRTDPDSPSIDHLTRKIGDLAALAAFALPLIRTLGGWPARAAWSEWLTSFEALAPRVLRRPEHVLRVLADLRPMGAVGPVGLDEAAQVLAARLTTIEAELPARRYGRVFVATPAQIRGRSFDVVFVPALAERLFPQKPREDPLLLDEARRILQTADDARRLPLQSDRAEAERLQLLLAAGAAERRLYISFPTIEITEGRPRVPSLYALEVWRAMTGRVPGSDELLHAASRASGATLAWPAPADRDEAIDALEHDLATLRHLVGEPEERARGRAQYILQLNDCLQRSVRERYMRSKPAWTHWDGLTRVTPQTSSALTAHRLTKRAYSLSALQKYASCPYQFLLGAIYKLRPAEDLGPLQRLDPLTRGSLFHAVQAAFYRRLKAAGELPVTEASRARAFRALDEAVRHVAAEYREQLAPAIERVWEDEIAAIRRDLRLWVDEIARAGGEWIPRRFEWAFGLGEGGPRGWGEGAERDIASHPDPVVLDGRFPLRGSIDLVEERAGSGDLRVTDHKTGKYRGKEQMVVGGGGVLQPVLYGLVLEAATGRPVTEGRLYYATTDGGYRDVRIPLTAAARREGIEVLEIIDRAVERGFLAPSPGEKACDWCDFRTVCGPGADRRNRWKSREALADLIELRRKP
jgi:CRISPR/Cas system-associated exonuclease Cas4 (RecB family)